MDSTQLTGANVDDLRALAQSFDRSADRLMQAAQQVGSSIADPRGWGGRDAERFRSTFASSTRPSMSRVASDLHAAATQLRTEATEQETASAAVGGASGAASVTGADIWETTKFVEDTATGTLGWAGEYSKKVAKWLAGAHLIDSKDAAGVAKDLKSVGRWADGVGSVFSFASAAQDAHDFGVALAQHDTNAEWEQGTKLVSDTINTFPFLKVVPALGLLSAAGDSYQLGEAIGRGDTSMAIDKGVAVAGSGLMAVAVFTGPAAPFVAGAGLALTIGSQAYEHREQIGAVANSTWNAVSGLAKAEASGLSAITSKIAVPNIARSLF